MRTVAKPQPMGPVPRRKANWGTFPQRVAASGGVTYVAGEQLHDWLLGQRPCLKRTELAALSAANVPDLFSSE